MQSNYAKVNLANMMPTLDVPPPPPDTIVKSVEQVTKTLHAACEALSHALAVVNGPMPEPSTSVNPRSPGLAADLRELNELANQVRAMAGSVAATLG